MKSSSHGLLLAARALRGADRSPRERGKAGIDPKPAFDMLTSTILATPGLKRTAAVLTAGQEPPASAIAHKDIGLFRELASSATQSTPLADRVADIWDRR